jgi:3-deoxy-D-manno-octulosonic-acid transferase
MQEDRDISMHKNTVPATSYFASASDYDFFGGYDHAKQCGVVHIGDHHVSPGKKMFTWGYCQLAKSWENALTDEDGQYAELMAGSYSDNQPNFSWLEAYESKEFSQFWYPISQIGTPEFANLKCAFKIYRGEENTFKIQSTEGYKNVTISGDTRFDRVMRIANNAKSFADIEEFCRGDKKIILAGSSWLADERIIEKAIKNLNVKLIIAPHIVGEAHINEIQKLFPNSILYSELAENKKESDVLIINCIGILSNLYQYCDIAYIGGGFGVGIHNTLEAATFGKPICFGTNYHKFQEAVDLINLKAAYSINNEQELRQVFKQLLNNEEVYNNSAKASKNYVGEKIGACNKIINHLSKQDESK